ncbi:MAG: HepT-like ribonuclease domain-containing protein [Phycisphaeraceae bacterium]
MPPEIAKFLRDILDSGNRIVDYTQGKSLDDYLKDGKLRDAVQWNFAVAGEALSQLSKLDEPTARRITEYRRIVSFRNQLIHAYGVIKNEITWDIVKNKLPILIREIETLLSTA